MPASRSLEMDMHRLQKRHPEIADEIGHLEGYESFREANDVISGLEMLAYDTGCEGGRRLPRWMLKVGRVLKVDVEGLRKAGSKDAGLSESIRSDEMADLGDVLSDIEDALLESKRRSRANQEEWADGEVVGYMKGKVESAVKALMSASGEINREIEGRLKRAKSEVKGGDGVELGDLYMPLYRVVARHAGDDEVGRMITLLLLYGPDLDPTAGYAKSHRAVRNP